MKSHLLERIPTHCPSARECQCYRSRPASRNTLEKSECSQRLSRRLVAESEQSVGGSPDWIELLSLNLQPALLSALQESFLFHRRPTVTGQWPRCTVPNSQSACRWSVQLEPACIFLCIVSSQAPRTKSQDPCSGPAVS